MQKSVMTLPSRRNALLAAFAAVILAVATFLAGAPAAAATAPTGTAQHSATEAVQLASREENALAWARSVLGHTHTNGDLGDTNHPWNGWCDNFVAHAYGRAASGYATAVDHYNSLNARGLINTGSNPPAGALTFYAAASINNYAGHVMLSEGDGNYITTAAQISRVSQTWPGAPYLGWSYADPEWPGR
jgi:hypothetical protein